MVTEVGCTWSSGAHPGHRHRAGRGERQQPQRPRTARRSGPSGRRTASIRSSSSCWTRTTEVTIAIPSAAGDQPWATHWRCASRIGSRSLRHIAKCRSSRPI